MPDVIEFEWLYNQYNDNSPFPTPNVSVLSPVFFLGLIVHNFFQTSKSSFLTCSSKVDLEKLYVFFDLGIFPSNTDAISSSYSFDGVSGSGFFSFGFFSGVSSGFYSGVSSGTSSTLISISSSSN